MIVGTLTGAVLGLASGLLFALAIHYIVIQFGGEEFNPATDAAFTAFLGMGFGTIIGSILGAVYSNK